MPAGIAAVGTCIQSDGQVPKRPFREEMAPFAPSLVQDAGSWAQAVSPYWDPHYYDGGSGTHCQLFCPDLISDKEAAANHYDEEHTPWARPSVTLS